MLNAHFPSRIESFWVLFIYRRVDSLLLIEYVDVFQVIRRVFPMIHVYPIMGLMGVAR